MIEYLKTERTVIEQAPIVFLIGMVLVAGLALALVRWIYRAQIDAQTRHIAFLTDQLNAASRASTESPEQTTSPTTPHYALWSAVHEFTLWQVAHLWVDQEPKSVVVPGDRAYPVLRRLKQDAKNNRLTVHSLSDRGQIDAWATVSRDSLVIYAIGLGEFPEFLFPDGKVASRASDVDSE